MNIQEKKLIEAFLNKEDPVRHGRAVEILFYGTEIPGKNGAVRRMESSVTRAIRHAVFKCYSGNSYSGRRDEVYATFVTEFYQYLIRLKPEKLRGIDSLDNWMFRAAVNFANGHRQAINQALGIEEGRTEFSAKLDRAEESEGKDLPADTETSSKWAEDLLGTFIERIPHAYYREILYAVDIHGMSLEDFAEEQGKKITAIHNDHRHAKLELIEAALSDIRWRSRKLHDRYRDELNEKDNGILQRFFDGQTGTDKPETCAVALSKLLKLSRRAEAQPTMNP